MIVSKDFQLTTLLYESSSVKVYRGHCLSDKKPLIFKILKNEQQDTLAISSFKHEYEIVKKLDIPGVVKGCGLERYDNTLMMAFNDIGGASLSQILKEEKLTIEEFLLFAIDLCQILDALFHQNIIHKDINPNNIIWNKQTNTIEVIDFGIACRASQKNGNFEPLETIEGTLPYISPEQTGRMNRAVDYRTDFYSLGMTFYEMLAGKLPFLYEDPMEIIHAHLAQIPAPLSLKKKIPTYLSNVIEKLISKMAEDRYQSYSGLIYDLQTCLAIYRGEKESTQFTLGQNDIVARFQIPQKLYGREQEIRALQSSFDKMLRGEAGLLLIKGYAGVGKSSVIYELHKSLTRKEGYFFEGKFDQYQKNTPYSAWIQAFESFTTYLLMEGDTKLAYWKSKILTTVGKEGKVLTDVIPNLELIIGPQPEVPELGTIESQNRFNYLLMNFMKVIAQKEHPVIIFLDDLQWIDLPSISLLELLLANNEISYLHIIGAYRDNEVSDEHILQKAIKRIKETDVSVDSITLNNLQERDIEQLLSETLLVPIPAIRELSSLIYKKTKGNAFFTHQFLHSMKRKELISFDSQKREWHWDQKSITSLAISENVVELLVEKLTDLPQANQELLKRASFIGNTFSKELINIISECSEDDLETQCQNCIEDGTLYRIKGGYRFVHDRIQQAANTLASENEQIEVHWKVGNLLLNRLSSGQREKKIFEIANHLLSGKGLDRSESERSGVLPILLEAAQKAKKANAYDLAAKYLNCAIEALTQTSWIEEYEQTLSFYNEHAEISYLMKEYEKMEADAAIVFNQSKIPEDSIRMYHTKIQAYIGKNESRQAIRTALTVLKKLDLTLVENPGDTDIHAAFGLIAQLREKYKERDLISLPEMKHGRDIAIVQLLASIIGPAYNTNPPLLLLIVLKIVELSLTQGNTEISAIGYAMYGLFLAGMMSDFDAAYSFGELAYAVTDKYNGQIVRPRVTHLVNCFIVHWKTDAKVTLEAFQQAYEQALIVGDHEFASHALTNFCATSFTTGSDLEHLKIDAQKYAEIMGTKLEQEVMKSFVTLFHQAAINLTSDFSENSTRLDGDVCKEFEVLNAYEAVQNATGIALFYTIKLFLQYHFGEYENAHASSLKAHPYLQSIVGLNISVSFVFYESLTLLKICKTCDQETRESLLQNVTENQEKMHLWAENAPMNHYHKWALVEAVKESLEGQSEKAELLFEEAIEGAKKYSYIHEEALANELYAKYWLRRRRENFAQLFFNAAIMHYKSWGAKAKAAYLHNLYPQLLEPDNEIPGTLHETGTFSGTLNVDTLLKSTYALTEEIVLDKLLGKMLKIVMENAGAEEGFLLLESEGSWVVEAEISVNEPVLKTLHSQPLAPTDTLHTLHICGEIVNYVLRTHKSVMLADAVNSEEFGQCHYIVQMKPKSIMAIPLLHKKDLKGIVYLENNLATNAFTQNHLNILQLLSAEMAITIQNAQLYSALQKKNEELQHSTKIAQQASQVKSDFLANLSHEIRTPINAIVSMTNFLLEEDVSDNTKNLIEEVHNNTSSLMNIVNHILDFSDVESGHLTLNESALNLTSFITILKELLEAMAKSKELDTTITVDEELPTAILCDSARIRQALVCLFENAVKFTHKGSVSLTIRVKKNTLSFEVVDTGIGIEEKRCGTIFNAFTQADTSTTRQYGGLGLGLTLVKEIAALMSGTVTVSSTPGTGSTFTFTIPVTVLHEQVEKTGKTVHHKRSELRILVVEDNHTNQKIILKLLEKREFSNTAVAENGEEALLALIENHFDIILMDCQMPIMDGYQATQAIRNSSDSNINSTIPIIAITANAMPGDREKCINAGMDDYLPKPVDIIELEGKIMKLTGVS